MLIAYSLIFITFASSIKSENSVYDGYYHKLDAPSCFNCMLGDYPCRNWAACSPLNGTCICPLGFTSNDCSVVGKRFGFI